MNHARTRRWVAGTVVTTLLGGLLTLLAVAPAQADHEDYSLEISKEVNTPNVGAAVELTARVTPTALSDVLVHFELENGPADADGVSRTSPDKTCTVETGSSTCTIAVSAAVPGQTIVRGWVDHDNTPNVVEADPTELRLSSALTDCATETDPDDFAACSEGGAGEGTTAEPDSTDLVLIDWVNNLPRRLSCDPESAKAPLSVDISITCTVRNTANVGIAGIRIDGENINAPNDPDSNNGGSADYNDLCVTNTSGTCTGTVTGGAQEGFGDICFWADQDSDNGITSPTYVPAGDEADGGGCTTEVRGDAEYDDLTDKVQAAWEPRVRTNLDVTPELPSNVVGASQTFTATVTDQFGQEWPEATTVTFRPQAGSENTTPKSCATSGTGDHPGRCTVSFTSATTGIDVICAYFGAAPDASCNGETQSGGTNSARIDVVQASWQAASTTTTTTTTQQGGGQGDPAQGYSLVGEDGSLYAYGTAKNLGDMKGKPLNAPIIGVAYTPGGSGYWLVAKDGGIFTFGNADFYGSMGDKTLNSPVIGMAATPTGKGYWLFAGDGGIFTFGDAEFFGSMGDKKLNQPVINMEPLASGNGYWLVAADGGIFTFGQAEFFGSMGDKKINQPVFDMTSTDTDKGYWLVARDGGVFSFGDAETKFYGNPVNDTNPKPTRIIGMDSTPSSLGYWIADANGKVWNYGNAQALGDRFGANNPAPMIGFASVPGLKP